MSKETLSLLLLPFPSPPTEVEALEVALSPPITAALKKIARTRDTKPTLVIAVPCSIISIGTTSSTLRQERFKSVQRLVTGVYELTAQICKQHAISRNVDFQVVLLRPSHAAGHRDSNRLPQGKVSAAVVSLEFLAGPRRHWNHVYTIESEGGYGLFQEFLALSLRRADREGRAIAWEHGTVPGGLQITVNCPDRGKPPPADRDDQIEEGYTSVQISHFAPPSDIEAKTLATMALFVLDRLPTCDRASSSRDLRRIWLTKTGFREYPTTSMAASNRESEADDRLLQAFKQYAELAGLNGPKLRDRSVHDGSFQILDERIWVGLTDVKNELALDIPMTSIVCAGEGQAELEQLCFGPHRPYSDTFQVGGADAEYMDRTQT